jgi:glycosyltransferase involved in cell wall biosynthesis
MREITRKILDKPSSRPRLLFLCQRNPWGLNNGGVIRNYWLIHALSARFDVDLVTADDAHDEVPADFRALCAGIHRFTRPTGIRAKATRAVGALRPWGTFFTSGSVTAKMRSGVAELMTAHRYSAVMTELGLIDAIPAGDVPVVYSAHNCEAALLLRRAKLEPIWSRAAITLDALRLRRIEARLIERAWLVTPCSQNDLDDMRAFAPSVDAKAIVIPNGVDCATYADVAAAAGTPGVILVTGSFDWLPNRRGLMWFIKDVLPVLEQLLADREFSVRIAGRMSADFAKQLGEISPHVVAAPNVPRMDVELRGASVVAVPVIASSGTRLRILEAWAAGRPVVTTPHGAFGLEHADGIDLFSCQSPRQFAEAAVLLLKDADLRARLHDAGLVRAASYDWSSIGRKLVASLEEHGLISPAIRKTQPIRVES